jgi:hypothetical protein
MTRYKAERFERAWGEYIAASDHHSDCAKRVMAKREHVAELEGILRATREKLEELEDEARHALGQSTVAKTKYEAAMRELSPEEVGEAVKRVLDNAAARGRGTTAASGNGQKGPLST